VITCARETLSVRRFKRGGRIVPAHGQGRAFQPSLLRHPHAGMTRDGKERTTNRARDGAYSAGSIVLSLAQAPTHPLRVEAA